ncbi:MAG: hypothetical protein WCI48_02200 [Bacteroidota bacterium]|jgi:uncharacterized protein YlxW (UPF0749 family)
MKKVVVLVSAIMLFAGLTFAQTTQTKDQKPAEKKEAPKTTEKKDAKPAEKKEATKPAAKPAAKPAEKPAEPAKK